MKTFATILVAGAVASLSSSCVLPPPYYDPPYAPSPDGPPVAVAPLPPGEIIVPEVVIVEGGVRHDRYFYERHPEVYRRDRARYPDRFVVAPGVVVEKREEHRKSHHDDHDHDHDR